MIHVDIETYNEGQEEVYRDICRLLASLIDKHLPEAECKIWHRHPVWFLDGNPTVGYSTIKAGLRLMFWSGASFDEEALKPGTGKFKDASILFSLAKDMRLTDLKRWLKKSKSIQWDYKNVAKRKGQLVRLQ